MITLRCANCGAPLEVDDHASLVQCKYCHATTRVRDRTLQLPATPPVVPTAPVVYEKPQSAPWPQGERAGRRDRDVPKGRGLVSLLVSVGVFVAIAGGMIAFATKNGGGGSILGGLSSMAPAPVMYTCLVDANSDATLDVAAMRTRGDTYFAEMFDGSSGASLWRGEDVTGSPHLICVGHHVALVLGDFTTRIHDVRAPGTPLVVRGGDVTRTIRQGPGCLDLEAADGSHLSVAVDGSNVSQCEPDGSEHGFNDPAPGIMTLTEHEVELADGEQTLRLRARSQGTAVLSFRTRSDADDQPTSLMKCTFSAAIAASPTTVFLQACPPGADKAGMVVAFRKTDLAELWRMPIADGSSWDVNRFSWNGAALIVQASGGLYAIDGASGATLWSVR